MNSTEGIKGFLTFIGLLAIVGASVYGIRFLPQSTNTSSVATEKSIIPQDINLNQISAEEFEIKWYTEVASVGTIIYSQRKDDKCFTKESMHNTECLKASEKDKGQHHIVLLDNLEPDSTYFYKVATENNVYPEKEDLSFSTKEIVQDTPSTKVVPEADDFSGFSNVEEDGVVQPKKVLGKSKYGDRVTSEFKQAILFQNLKYDFNNDGDVTLDDYPYFVEFILNEED